MSGACRFACATKEKYDAKDVVAQPSALPGRLTQCPVSGVVFAVEPSRPHVHLGVDEYVTCCETCAEKLKNDTRLYLSGTDRQAGLTERPTLGIQLLSFDGCPYSVKTRVLLQDVIASAGIDASIEEVDLDSPATPVALRGWGSPTVLVNGRDVGGLEAPPGTSCRIYRDDAGRHAGYPSAALLRTALVPPGVAIADRSH
jgi:glutaredoxin